MKILTTKKDLKKIVNEGCIECGNNDFSYYSSTRKIVCNKCQSEYAYELSTFVSMLGNDESNFRIYTNENVLENYLDLEISTKIRRKARYKTPHSYR